METRDLLSKFDLYLEERGLHFEAIIIGGAALNLLGIVSRYTRDCDLLEERIPQDITNASKSFAEKMRGLGNTLRDDWFNNGPSSLVRDLPKGWLDRLRPAFNGNALILRTLGRSDLIKTKFFAFCDRGSDKSDCIHLNPSRDELKEAAEWTKELDGNPAWPEHVENSRIELLRELKHEF